MVVLSLGKALYILIAQSLEEDFKPPVPWLPINK